MAVFQQSFRCSTRGRCDVVDVTPQVERIVTESKLRQGIVNVSGRGSTLGITTLEYEPGCVSDLARALERIAPVSSDYAHNARWGDDNGYSHLRSALMGTARSFPLSDGSLGLGTWQVQRLHWKQAILAQIAQAEAGPPVPLPASPTQFQKVEVSGHLRDYLAAARAEERPMRDNW